MDNKNQFSHEVMSGIDTEKNMGDNPPPYSANQSQPSVSPQMPITHQPEMYPHGGAVGTVGTGIGQPGTMTMVAPNFAILNQMVPQSTPFMCPTCNKQIVTKVKRNPTFKTHFFAAAFCLAGCVPCAVIPYCMDGFMQTDHYCPDCDNFLGSYIP